MRVMGTRFRVLFISVLVAFAAVACAQVKLTLSVGGQKVGSTEFTYKKLPGGGIRQSVVMRMSMGGRSAVFSSESEYAKSGRQVSESERQSEDGKDHVVRKLLYGATSLVVTETIEGNTSKKTYPYPKGASMASISTFWFITAKPMKNQVDKYTSFNNDTKLWKEQSVTYAGDKSFQVGGKTVVGHELKHNEGSVWVDDKGYPIRVELSQGGATIVMNRE